eukprot:scaffold68351_cov57-Phaeocystis_antarctica.AAC.2
MKRLTNLNEAARSQSIVSAVQWHPNGQMAMASGMDKVRPDPSSDPDPDPGPDPDPDPDY